MCVRHASGHNLAFAIGLISGMNILTTGGLVSWALGAEQKLNLTLGRSQNEGGTE